ncbi:STAS domain-containing protein [Oceanobacillus sp. CF4.6]|uniref:STAS domain-containing protein n=1 Tax=Oceanobacillus sp. CF4.6 TaxID=3373080 RepID=UPI003EE7F67F
MEQINSTFPLPMFSINKNLDVLGCSSEVSEAFHEPDSLLDIIDVESRTKVKASIHPDNKKTYLEVDMVGKSGELILADLYVKWNSGFYGEVLIITKDRSMEKVTNQLDTLQSRLKEKELELLKEKERMDELLEDNIKLSAPFIVITQDVALIPLFGDLDENKVNEIRVNTLNMAYSCEANSLLIDFTAVGAIGYEGLSGLKNLFASLQTLGKEVIITGIHPKQAQRLHHLDIRLNIRFIQSPQVAIKELFNKVSY